MEKEFYFNWNLAQRFVNDYRLPIPIISPELFQYHLDLYNEEMGSMDKWNKLIDYISNYFIPNKPLKDETLDTRVNAFLERFYEVREKIVTDIPSKPSFIKFNEMDMSKYQITNLKSKCSSLYNETNIGKTFLSIDLSKANFQALNYVDKSILESDTYEGFIKKYTDIYYILESKYFRQVIFGQMNPKRHTTVEKYMIRKIHDAFISEFGDKYPLIVANSDELVYEVDGIINLSSFNDIVKNEYGMNIHTQIFTLDGYNFFSERENHKRCTFYNKRDLENDGKHELMCIPMPYHALIYKMFHGIMLHPLDYHFSYENIDCIFNDTFRIELINNGNNV